MGKAIKKPVEIEFVTFDEFIEYGHKFIEENPTEGNYGFHDNGNARCGLPWHFKYQGHPVTHENDECYLIPTLEGTHNFTPKDVLITGVKGEIYPCKIDIFKETYEVIQDRKDTVTVQEVLKPNIQISKYGPSVANNDPKVQHSTMVGVKISINQFKDCKTHEGKN